MTRQDLEDIIRANQLFVDLFGGSPEGDNGDGYGCGSGSGWGDDARWHTGPIWDWTEGKFYDD